MNKLHYGSIILLETRTNFFFSNLSFFNENLEIAETDQYDEKFLNCLFIILPCIEIKKLLWQKKTFDMSRGLKEMKTSFRKINKLFFFSFEYRQSK
jgi:hypothetical protein